MIEKNSIQGCIDYFNTLSVHLKQESDKFVSSNPQSQASGKRKIRKRRVRTQHSTVPEIHKLKPTRHLSLIDKQTRQAVKSPLTPSTPVRSKLSYLVGWGGEGGGVEKCSDVYLNIY